PRQPGQSPGERRSQRRGDVDDPVRAAKDRGRGDRIARSNGHRNHDRSAIATAIDSNRVDLLMPLLPSAATPCV
ncbi:MAG: hypothetical protein MUF03_15180, partial [Rubrivivax sp.]|nr:hypothetical protein [Rubrivivax sp.]